MGLDRTLLKYAAARVKIALVPSDQAAAMGGGGGGGGGGPPPDAAAMMGGGAPPGMDPSMMGGGGAPPPAPPPAPPAPAQPQQQPQQQAPGGKAPKADINTVATDVFQLKKMIFHLFRANGMELPPDVLDGPNRDPVTGAASAAPTGGSDPNAAAAQQMSQQQPGAVAPIEPMQGAMPTPKQAGYYQDEEDHLSASVGSSGVGLPVGAHGTKQRTSFSSVSDHARAVAGMFHKRAERLRRARRLAQEQRT